MRHIVSLSGGSASAVAADRVIEKYGGANVELWFADTLWEDEDLYRFLEDLENRWEKTITRHTDGRKPLETHMKWDFIPNSRYANCSYELKQKPFREFLKGYEKPVTIHLGLDWTEEHRHAAPKKVYEAIKGVSVDFPLMWKPLAFIGYNRVVKEWGIEPPRLYSFGFPHNNCGGRCVRQGNKEWLRLAKYFPERFAEVRDWEKERRENGVLSKDRSISSVTRNGRKHPLTLEDLEKQSGTDQIDMFDYQGDEYGCFCTY